MHLVIISFLLQLLKNGIWSFSNVFAPVHCVIERSFKSKKKGNETKMSREYITFALPFPIPTKKLNGGKNSRVLMRQVVFFKYIIFIGAKRPLCITLPVLVLLYLHMSVCI